ncbi:hypothetical protein BZG36_03362 [Bifiguratus adelaidae]|uniref:Major facilitator superfamily (MFS) profile domain-containing protein n=1 Tax=Bifiguratus adelaidae TaxID=1938954 RepID=A0A261XXK0_9FUNG|nr:hypothetical protein BZG36_03362 [Bifiguratus adelaidae]
MADIEKNAVDPVENVESENVGGGVYRYNAKAETEGTVPTVPENMIECEVEKRLRSSTNRAIPGLALTMSATQVHALAQAVSIISKESAVGIALLYAAFAIFNISSNMIITKVKPGLWLARIVVTFGVITALMAVINNQASFYVLRAAEAEVGDRERHRPKVLIRGEVSQRVGLFYFITTVSGIVGVFIGAGLEIIDGAGGLYSWKWVFIIAGVATVVCGVSVWFLLPSSIDEFKGLTDEEIACAHMRLDIDRAMCQYRVLLAAVIYMCPNIVGSSLQNYLPTVIAQLAAGRFAATQATLIIIPYSVS